MTRQEAHRLAETLGPIDDLWEMCARFYEAGVASMQAEVDRLMIELAFCHEAMRKSGVEPGIESE